MIFGNIVILGCGLLIFIAGCYYCKFYKWRKVKGYIPVILGLYLVYLPTLGPLSHATEKINEVVQVNPDSLISIIIKPSNDASYTNLIDSDKTITNRKVINQLCGALHKINVHDEGLLKTPKLVGLIQFNMKDRKTVIFEVRELDERTTLSLESEGTSGWFYATLEAYDFGQALNSILK